MAIDYHDYNLSTDDTYSYEIGGVGVHIAWVDGEVFLAPGTITPERRPVWDILFDNPDIVKAWFLAQKLHPRYGGLLDEIEVNIGYIWDDLRTRFTGISAITSREVASKHLDIAFRLERLLVMLADCVYVDLVDYKTAMSEIEPLQSVGVTPPGLTPPDKIIAHYICIKPLIECLLKRLIDRAMPCMLRRYSTPMPGYVYLFHLETGVYKIGFSVDPSRRIPELVRTLPITITEVWRAETNQMKAAEEWLHRKYNMRRIDKTEWFNLTEKDVAEICAIEDMHFDWLTDAPASATA